MLTADGTPVSFRAVWGWLDENATSDDPYEFKPTIAGCNMLYVADGKLNFKDKRNTEYDLARSSLRPYFTRAMKKLAQN